MTTRYPTKLASSPSGATKPILIAVGPGELTDRLTILELKRRYAQSPAQRRRVEADHARIARVHADAGLGTARFETLVAALREVNGALWAVEDELRRCESAAEFGPRFVALARAVYRHNDRRAALKRAIDLEAGAPAGEEKIYPTATMDVQSPTASRAAPQVRAQRSSGRLD